MMKNKNIFLLGVMFFLLALVKYFFTEIQMPVAFIVLELLSFMVVLLLIYYVLNYKDKDVQLNKEKDCAEYKQELSRLNEELSIYKDDLKQDEKEQYDEDLLFLDLRNSFDHDGNKEVTAQKVLAAINKHCEWMAAVAYCTKDDKKEFVPVATYGIDDDWNVEAVLSGDGIHGQAILDNKAVEITDIPEEYFDVNSGTGSAKPKYLYLLPFINEKDRKGVLIEMATFKRLNLLQTWARLNEVLNN